jgi:hypothetical protein
VRDDGSDIGTGIQVVEDDDGGNLARRARHRRCDLPDVGLQDDRSGGVRVASELGNEARLAGAALADDQPDAVLPVTDAPPQRVEPLHLGRPADEGLVVGLECSRQQHLRHCFHGLSRWGEVGRKLGLDDLEQFDSVFEVLQCEATKRCEGDAGGECFGRSGRGRFRDDDLRAVGAARHASGLVQRQRDVVAVDHRRFTSVHAHPDTKWGVLWPCFGQQSVLRVHARRHRAHCTGERKQHPVAFDVESGAAVGRNCRAQQLSVAFEEAGVARTETAKQLR